MEDLAPCFLLCLRFSKQPLPAYLREGTLLIQQWENPDGFGEEQVLNRGTNLAWVNEFSMLTS